VTLGTTSTGQPRLCPGERIDATVALINLHVNATGDMKMASETGTRESEARLYFKLCSDHLSIEAIPRKAMRVNLTRLKDRSFSSHQLILWTPHFVVLRNQDGHEITLRKDGRMIIRKVASEELARRAADDVLSAVQDAT
jgi:hypothetical protein